MVLNIFNELFYYGYLYDWLCSWKFYKNYFRILAQTKHKSEKKNKIIIIAPHRKVEGSVCLSFGKCFTKNIGHLMFFNFYTTCHIENVSIWPRFYIKTNFFFKITTPENVENIFLLKKTLAKIQKRLLGVALISCVINFVLLTPRV